MYAQGIRTHGPFFSAHLVAQDRSDESCSCGRRTHSYPAPWPSSDPLGRGLHDGPQGPIIGRLTAQGRSHPSRRVPSYDASGLRCRWRPLLVKYATDYRTRPRREKMSKEPWHTGVIRCRLQRRARLIVGGGVKVRGNSSAHKTVVRGVGSLNAETIVRKN
jgi:hypothetical protein